MKKDATLSLEQKKARDLYKSAYIRALYLAIFVTTVVGLAAIHLLIGLGIRGFNGGVGVGGGPVLGIWFGHYWALRRVRRAGMSLERTEVEVLNPTTDEFSGEPVEWWFPKTAIGKIGLAFSPFLLGAAAWWPWHSSQSFWLQGTLGAAGFVMFSAMGIINLLFIKFPDVRIDEEGIVGFQKDWWRRRALWRDVTRCEIKRATNFSGEMTSHWFTFKDENGRVLLALTPRSMFGLTADEREAIAAEIKRRMS